jgi:hypothetical protein
VKKDFSILENNILPRKRITGSKFLDSIYNDPVKYQKYQTVVDELRKEMETRKIEEARFSQCTLPLGFPKPMLLSDGEEQAIKQAVLEMARAINEGKYVLLSNFSILRFDVSDTDRTDFPIPYIKMTVRFPIDMLPKHGFYLSGIFQKEKICREIVKAKIDKITFATEDMRKFVLATF